MESAGCVFLPAAGFRKEDGTTVSHIGWDTGFYWTSTVYDAGKASISTWLCGIAHHCAVNFLLSKAYRSGISMETLIEEGNFPEESRNDWEEGTDKWTLWEILRRLSVKERELLNYRYMLGLSNKEIAEKLQIGEKAVSERYRRLLAKCRKIAANEEDGS